MSKIHRYILLPLGGGVSLSRRLRRQRVGGKPNVYVCLRGVGRWSKIGKKTVYVVKVWPLISATTQSIKTYNTPLKWLPGMQENLESFNIY